MQHALGSCDGAVLAIPAARLGLYVVGAAFIGVLAAVWPARRAARMNVLDAISTP